MLHTFNNINSDEAPRDRVDPIIVLYQKGHLQDALSQAQGLIQEYPNTPVIHNLLGVCFSVIGQTKSSFYHFKKALKLDPSNPATYNNLGAMLLDLNQYEEAQKMLEHALRIKPDFAEAHNNVGNLMKEQKNYEKAIHAYEKAIDIYPDYYEAYNNLGIVQNGLQKYKAAEENFSKAIDIQPKFAEAHSNLGTALRNQKKYNKAIQCFEKTLQLDPYFAEAYNNKGNCLKEKGLFNESIIAFDQAISLKQNYADAFYNKGVTLKEKGDLNNAIENFKRANNINPAFTESLYNMGNAQRDKGELKAAVESYKRVIAIDPNYAGAYHNMGMALKEMGELEAAIDSYNRVIKLEPNYAEVYNNLGIALTDKEDQDAAIKKFKQAIKINPDYSAAYSNMGNIFTDKGNLSLAIENYTEAIKINPESDFVWNNLLFPMQCLKVKNPLLFDRWLKRLDKLTPENARKKIKTLTFKLNRGSPKVIEVFKETLDQISKDKDLNIRNPNQVLKEGTQEKSLPQHTFALIPAGRPGTSLLHSLIDNHSEVSTLPSTYFSEYFDSSIWKKITCGGWNEMVDRFILSYPILFDASASDPVLSISGKWLRNFGKKEGLCNVGDRKDETLTVDRKLFRTELNKLMNFHEHHDAFSFFKLVHVAYETVVNKMQKDTLFYNIHNPDIYAQLNFMRLSPDTKWIMMVREPIQSFESWLMELYQKGDYCQLAKRIFTMLFQIDNIVFYKHNSIGLRIEDLKNHPHKVLPALCEWMGIKEERSLYQMTVQGKKYWGIPSSPDFEKNGMNPFDGAPISRKIGAIFSKKDQYILNTLFYPFRVRFGYIKENHKKFLKDLKAIYPMLEQMFDFEIKMFKKRGIDPQKFIKSGSFQYLRSGLIERWNTLDQFQTYPNMIKPLTIPGIKI